jgi:hypothetical protein
MGESGEFFAMILFAFFLGMWFNSVLLRGGVHINNKRPGHRPKPPTQLPRHKRGQF